MGPQRAECSCQASLVPRERLSDSNESFPAGVSCSWKERTNAACLAGAVVPAGEIFSGTSVAYLRIVFPAWFFSSFSAALSGRTAELNAIKA